MSSWASSDPAATKSRDQPDRSNKPTPHGRTAFLGRFYCRRLLIRFALSRLSAALVILKALDHRSEHRCRGNPTARKLQRPERPEHRDDRKASACNLNRMLHRIIDHLGHDRFFGPSPVRIRRPRPFMRAPARLAIPIP